MSGLLALAWLTVLALLLACWEAAGDDLGFLLFDGLLLSVAIAAFLSALALCQTRWTRDHPR